VSNFREYMTTPEPKSSANMNMNLPRNRVDVMSWARMFADESLITRAGSVAAAIGHAKTQIFGTRIPSSANPRSVSMEEYRSVVGAG
tara:strand:- start:2554 stop:2814 length:261 start_codon:yes stop_codon:yes gene_type:complete